MLGLAPSGEGKMTNLKSFTNEAISDTFNPRVLYLLKHLDTEKVNAIMNRMNRGEITGDEMMKLLHEATDACVPPEEKYEKEEDEKDECRDEVKEDGEMGKTLQLGDQEKPGIVKRPLSSHVQSELESKKPKVAQGFLGGEPVAAEM